MRSFSYEVGLMPDFTISKEGLEAKISDNFLREVISKKEYLKLVEFAVSEEKKLSDIFKLFETLYEIDHHQPSAINHPPSTINYQPFYRLKEILENCEKGLSNSGKKALVSGDIEDIGKRTWICKESLKEYIYFKKCYTPEADNYFKELKKELRKYFRSKEAYLIRELLYLYSLYKEAKLKVKKEFNELDFKDVTNFVYQLLNTELERDFFYFRLDSKIDHILIDEFQDTSVVQYKILKPLFEEISAGSNELKTLFYVGDTKQSIYRFRGGAKELFYHVKKRFGIETKQLNVNYRSKKEIVEFVNRVFKPRLKGYFDQKPNEGNFGGFVKISENEDLIDEVVKNCFMLLKSGIKADDIAILTYTNDDISKIEEALLQEDATLKISTETTASLLHSLKVAAVVEMLKYLYFGDELYRANFLALIGYSWDDELLIDGLNINDDLVTLIKKIIKKFKLFEKDESLLKLIELSSRYKDIEEFLFNLDTFDEQMPKKELQGIKILTIHKSKGLEFAHLIVCDRIKRKNNTNSSFIYEHDDIRLKRLHLKVKNKECFDVLYKNALEQEKTLILEDELNAQYVAFTRAKESLIICKKEKSSSFDNLNLTPSQIGDIHHPPSTIHHPPLTINYQQKPKAFTVAIALRE